MKDNVTLAREYADGFIASGGILREARYEAYDGGHGRNNGRSQTESISLFCKIAGLSKRHYVCGLSTEGIGYSLARMKSAIGCRYLKLPSSNNTEYGANNDRH